MPPLLNRALTDSSISESLQVNCVGVTVGWAADCEVMSLEKHPLKTCLLGASQESLPLHEEGGQLEMILGTFLNHACVLVSFVNLTQARVIWEERTEESACLHFRLNGHLRVKTD